MPAANVIPPAVADATAAEATAALAAAVAAAAALATEAAAAAVVAEAAAALPVGAGVGLEKAGFSAKGAAPELKAGGASGRDRRVGRSADAGAAAAAVAGDDPRLNRPVVADADIGVGLINPGGAVDPNENARTGGVRGDGIGTAMADFGVDIVGDATAAAAANAAAAAAVAVERGGGFRPGCPCPA